MPAQYQRNKIRTVRDIVQRIENWPTAVDMRLRRGTPGLRLLNFRDGLNVICRAGRSGDWEVIHELIFAGSYDRGLRAIREAAAGPVVLDLGGNIGLFGLLAAQQRPDVTVHSFEPGPPNFRLFEMNRLANPNLADRMRLHREAVGGSSGTVNWFFDERNAGGSSLYGTSGTSFPVTIRAFSEVVAALGPVCLAKIDIEGAEFDLVRQTPPEVWQKVGSITLELHHDPAGSMTQTQFLDRMMALGFRVEDEGVCSFFLRRA